LQNIAVINGRPAVYGDAMLALVRGSAVCEDVREHVSGKGDDCVAVCEARRKGAAPVFGRFSVGDAKRAGLWDKAGPWKQYPLRMLQMRARGFALRDAFPDVLRGVISAEEAADIPRTMKDVTPAESGALSAELDAFGGDISVEESTLDLVAASEVLDEARAQALAGYATFRRWYVDTITDEERLSLRPHIKELRAAAVAAGAEPTPSEQPPLPADGSREDGNPGPQTGPPESISPDAIQPQRLAGRRTNQEQQ
jgi:hypothetical protein